LLALLRQFAWCGLPFFSFVEKFYSNQISHINHFPRAFTTSAGQALFDEQILLSQDYFYLSENFTLNQKNR